MEREKHRVDGCNLYFCVTEIDLYVVDFFTEDDKLFKTLRASKDVNYDDLLFYCRTVPGKVDCEEMTGAPCSKDRVQSMQDILEWP